MTSNWCSYIFNDNKPLVFLAKEHRDPQGTGQRVLLICPAQNNKTPPHSTNLPKTISSFRRPQSSQNKKQDKASFTGVLGNETELGLGTGTEQNTVVDMWLLTLFSLSINQPGTSPQPVPSHLTNLLEAGLATRKEKDEPTTTWPPKKPAKPSVTLPQVTFQQGKQKALFPLYVLVPPILSAVEFTSTVCISLTQHWHQAEDSHDADPATLLRYGEMSPVESTCFYSQG